MAMNIDSQNGVTSSPVRPFPSYDAETYVMLENMSLSSNADNNNIDPNSSLSDLYVISPLSTPKGTRFWIPEVEHGKKPIKGTKFDSLEQALLFYRAYAREAGFEVKKGGQYKHKHGHLPMLKYLYCVREGFKPKPKIVTNKKERRRRPSCRVGCRAQLRLYKTAGNRYVVYNFVEEHNHSLVHKKDVHFLKTSRKLTYTKKQLLHQVSNLNLGPVRGFKLMKEIYGGFESVGATSVDCKNFRRDMNLFIGECDAHMAVEKLMSQKDFLPGFSADYFKNDDDALGGLFWADQEAKKNFKCFGDIVSFDATFRSNKYKMVFVPFTGIDNHNRCVTFGAGLLSNESIESYKWLLQKFKEAFVEEPKVFVTDQDPAMKQAIEMVGASLCSNTDFKKQLCDIVWTDKLPTDVFEREWASIMKAFNLEGNKWLNDMFEIRSKWIPAYFRDEHMSGLMRTTSRSESENHFFGQLTSPHLTLVELLSHFNMAMDSQRFAYNKNQHDSRYTTPDFRTDYPMEKDVAQLYSRTIFYDVQDEIYASIMFCLSVNVVSHDEEQKFVIRDVEDNNGNDSTYEVLFNRNPITISCSCKRYERYGLFCRHVFYVLRLSGVNEFPKAYLLKRWSKEPLPEISNEVMINMVNGCEGESDVHAVVREISESVESSVNRLVHDLEKLQIYRQSLMELSARAEADFPIANEINQKDMFASLLGVSEPEEVTIQVPKGIRNKGCGSHKRIRSKVEISVLNSLKSKRKCKICKKSEGHDSRNCPYKKGRSSARVAGRSSSRAACRSSARAAGRSSARAAGLNHNMTEE